jgi:hypothetical protein
MTRLTDCMSAADECVRSVTPAQQASAAAAPPSLMKLVSTEVQQSEGRLTCLRVLDVDCDEVRRSYIHTCTSNCEVCCTAVASAVDM